ncbi:Pollen-specific leucine-rich repeat extensin-like protein 1 [Acorus calamus]|uniref:Cell wall hydroxyproline-rich glycoprotein n=1 Tax=Acorus calamus TaxID=4465 RepID=A0AAV9EY81_ACOCL|nr:Pollen-specific leucine-rich repeat extensin-like protein 1 [Acorus calamus]
MKALGCSTTTTTLLSLLLLLLIFSATALSDHEASSIARRQLLALPENGDLPDDYEFDVNTNATFPNPRLRRAYIALQAWRRAIFSDPFNTTGDWVGPNVCSYTGVFCSKALDEPNLDVVAGVDLNHADIAGYLPVELGLLTDVAVFHLNSNRFCGIVPRSLSRLHLLHELDLSNNRFVGPFPKVVLGMPALKYLDIRFNDFEGRIPSELFEKDLDAIFVNDNRFTSRIPDNLGESPASVVVLANNRLGGIGAMGGTLDEIILLNNGLSGCLPAEVGLLGNATVVDAGSNALTGVLPRSLSGLARVEELDLSRNFLTGFVSERLCKLPSLANFTGKLRRAAGFEVGRGVRRCEQLLARAAEAEVAQGVRADRGTAC